VIYVNNYKRRLALKRWAPSNSLNAKIISLIKLYLIFLLKTWKLAHGETLYAIHIKICYTSTNMDMIYAKDVSFMSLRASFDDSGDDLIRRT